MLSFCVFHSSKSLAEIWNKNCTLFALKISKFSSLYFAGSPIIQVSNQTVCDRTVNIQLLCIISGNLHHYGFSKWIHTINGNYLRKLNGRTRGNMSILLIDSCSFEDVGNYTCMAWNKNKNMEYWSNKSTTLTVNGKLAEYLEIKYVHRHFYYVFGEQKFKSTI